MYPLAHALFIVAAFAAALPEPLAAKATTTTTSTAFCSVVTSFVTAANAQSTATAYCSSFLGIQPTTTTVTAATTTAFPSSCSCAGAAVVTKRSAIADNPIDLVKRSVAKSSCFKSFTASALISSACSCLHVPTPTVTKSVVATATSTNFIVKAAYNQQYAVAANDNLDFTAATSSAAYVFRLLTRTCQLESGSTALGYASAFTIPGYGGTSVLASDNAIIFDNGYSYLYSNRGARAVTCSISLGTNALTCSSIQGSITTEQGDVWLVEDGTAGTLTALTAIPV